MGARSHEFSVLVRTNAPFWLISGGSRLSATIVAANNPNKSRDEKFIHPRKKPFEIFGTSNRQHLYRRAGLLLKLRSCGQETHDHIVVNSVTREIRVSNLLLPDRIIAICTLVRSFCARITNMKTAPIPGSDGRTIRATFFARCTFACLDLVRRGSNAPAS